MLQPGIYYLEDAIKVQFDNTVIFGMGLATLVPYNGTACIEVGNFEGVRISGVLLEASTAGSQHLLRFGEPGFEGNPQNPGLLADVFARAGRFYPTSTQYVSADVFVEVNAKHTIIDDVWLWRGDHDYYGLVYYGRNPVQHGLVVNAEDVHGYGLAVEHTVADLLVWNANNGHAYFFQSELPYDVSQETWGDLGYVGYRVAQNVTSHEAFGVGVYQFFRDFNVTVKSGIAAPDTPGVTFENSLCVHLSGLGEITHVINDQGDACKDGVLTNYYCEYPPTNEFLQ